MKTYLLLLPLAFSCAVHAQKKADRKTISNLQSHVAYLADDKLEGRRTGTAGEKLAYTYIADQMKASGLAAKGTEGYLQTFEVSEAWLPGKNTHLLLNDKKMHPGNDYEIMPFSGNKSAKGDVILLVNEPENVWILNVADWEKVDNPHADPLARYKAKADEAIENGAKGVIFYNGDIPAALVKKWKFEKLDLLPVPVLYFPKASSSIFEDENVTSFKVDCSVDRVTEKRTGTNVVGYIDNGAAQTVIIGAHYDHLGHGEDHNSLSPGGSAIHNGADDNASGTAAMLELARMLKDSKLKKFNYLFAAFSGEELGLFGSKYFVEHSPVPLNTANFMINMDMVGRLTNDKGLQIGGIGTSPAWPGIIAESLPKNLKITYDSSGIGPSDHTSFYLKDIPVLFFFTGTHTDYHKPTDDADKINYTGELTVMKIIYEIIEHSEDEPKLAFARTKEPKMSTGKFSVTLGIMPDYTYSAGGVRIDGISPGKVAEKAGLQAGDVVVKLGNYDIKDMESYMSALGKFKSGDQTEVIIKRGNEEKKFPVSFQ